MQSKFQNKAVLPKKTREVNFITSQNIFSVTFVIGGIPTLYHQSILGHNNELVAGIGIQPNVRRRFRRQWLSDLPQPADEEN
jgi:hypothetical protein